MQDQATQKDGVHVAACAVCGYEYPDPKAVAAQQFQKRKPCPVCGSTAIAYQVQLSSVVKTRTMFGLKTKRPDNKRPVLELKAGDNLHRDSGRWMNLERRIDRANNQYSEKITDQKTGKIVRDCNEPLTDHFGHGDAAKKH